MHRNNEYLHSSPLNSRSKFRLPFNEDVYAFDTPTVRVKCALCPSWAGTKTTPREMRAVYAEHVETRHV